MRREDSVRNRDNDVVVCLVDDDPLISRSVSRLLESDGLGVRTFGELTACLEHLATNPVSVVILDIWRGSTRGMELLAHLCARSPQSRVIFITGGEDRAAEAAVISAGAFAFFTKPFDAEHFLSAVRRALSNPVDKPSMRQVNLELKANRDQ